ncbi:MAG: hypothetical protein RL757_1537 [Bacteroidota bacterium]|jgi:hypothetical protein
MFIRKQIIIAVILVAYLSNISMTDISFTGFWTDLIFVFLLIVLFIKTLSNKYLKYATTTTLLIFALITFLSNPFLIDTFKVRSFYYQKVNGRWFHAYFKPVGAYSGGYGNFWITESPTFFPIIERPVCYERTVHHDFSDDTSDGQPIDNYEVVRSYIKEEIIKKSK